MRDRDVIPLEIVIDVDLPVALDHVISPLSELQTVETKAPRLFGNVAEKHGERFRARVEINEDEVFPGFDAERHHAHCAAIEKLHAFDVRCPDQSTVERIGPPMVAAAQDVLAAAARRDRPRAMAAYVAKCSQPAFFVTRDDDRFACNIRREKTLGITNRALDAVDLAAVVIKRADKLPRAPKNALLFKIEDRRIDVKARSQRLGALDALVHA